MTERVRDPDGACCTECHTALYTDNYQSVPYAMDTWDEDIPELNVQAGDAVWFCHAMCTECAQGCDHD